MRRIASTKLMNKLVVTVPKVVREMLELNPGDYIDWSIEDNKIIVTKGEKKIEKTK